MPRVKMQTDWVADTVSHTPVSRADTGRQSAVASAPYVDIAQTSRLSAFTLMVNETEPRSEFRIRETTEDILTSNRQFGTMTEKVADYEKLLKDLMSRVGDADAGLIRASLEKVRNAPLACAVSRR